MKHFLIVFLLHVTCIINAQVITQFTWDIDNCVTCANIGPNALSVSNSVFVDSCNQLNAGLPKQNINLVLPGNFYNKPSLRFEIDYQRDSEQFALFAERDSSLIFGHYGNNQLFAIFKVIYNNNVQTYNTGPLYSIPNDNIFRTYTFEFDSVCNKAVITVNDSVVWTQVFDFGTALYWENTNNNLVIGSYMDGYGQNNCLIDNLIISVPNCVPLPIDLLELKIETYQNNNILRYTVQGSDLDSFKILHTRDFKTFKQILLQKAYSDNFTGNYIHNNPTVGDNYYQIIAWDKHGYKKKSKFVHCHFELTSTVLVYPNPFKHNIFLKSEFPFTQVRVYNMQGQTIKTYVLNKTTFFVLNTYSFASGMYVVEMLLDNGDKIKFKTVK